MLVGHRLLRLRGGRSRDGRRRRRISGKRRDTGQTDHSSQRKDGLCHIIFYFFKSVGCSPAEKPDFAIDPSGGVTPNRIEPGNRFQGSRDSGERLVIASHHDPPVTWTAIHPACHIDTAVRVTARVVAISRAVVHRARTPIRSGPVKHRERKTEPEAHMHSSFRFCWGQAQNAKPGYQKKQQFFHTFLTSLNPRQPSKFQKNFGSAVLGSRKDPQHLRLALVSPLSDEHLVTFFNVAAVPWPQFSSKRPCSDI
jgi:hypothetical protein